MAAPASARPAVARRLVRCALHQPRNVLSVGVLLRASALLRAHLQRQLLAWRARLAVAPRRLPATSVAFRCNLCGARGSAPLAQLRDRETATCRVCRSNQRFRALMAALQDRLMGEVAPLRLMAARKDLAGIGMSDAGAYATWLERKFDYTNTFFHTAPFLDIQHPDARHLGRYDFVVTSDVLEHVAPPISGGFTNLRALLKSGGVLAMTVPYGLQDTTVEHFPDLHDFRIEGNGAHRRLLNRTRDGREQCFEDLCFHGGDGATLELRVFALADLMRQLEAAGFTDIRVHDGALPEWGILPDSPCSHPITAIAGPLQTAPTTPMR